MRRNNINHLRDDISAVDLEGSSDFAFVHREHPAIQFSSVPEVRYYLAWFNQRSLFDLGIVFLGHGVEVFVTHEVNGSLLCHFASLLLSLARFDDRADRFLHLFKRPLPPFLLTVHFDDVNSKLRLDKVTDCADAQAEGGLLEFRNHLAVAEISKVSACSSGRIFGILFSQAAEILALL